MIVRTRGERLLLITQPDHAHLAGAIMQHCAALADHPRRESILTAIAEHDNGWIEVDEAPVVLRDRGVIADFMSLADAARQDVWPRAVARLSRDPYAAALVAQHAVTAYARLRTDAGWAAFFVDMDGLRDAQLEVSGLSRSQLDTDYPFVRLGDVISLAFCTGSDALQVAPWRVEVSDTQVHVAPDPFGGVKVPVGIRARVLENRSYTSDHDLRGAFAAAEWTDVRGEVAGAASKFGVSR